MGVMLGALFGDRPTDEELYEAAEEAATLLQGSAAVRARAAAAAATAQRMWQARQQRAQRGGAGDARARQAPPASAPDPCIGARAVLGFTPQEPLTADMIKRRHRDLVRRHHPDRGGSTQRMAEVNAAVDVLLASM